MNKSKASFIICCLFLSLSQRNFANHIYGGEITYRYISGFTYEINLTIYARCNSQSGDIDMPVLDSVHLGNGIVITFYRDYYIDYIQFGNLIRASYYSEIHTYTGPGNYPIYIVIPNRAGNIANIPNSFYTPFSIRSELIIDQYCPNTSVNFGAMPVFFSQKNKVYLHQPTILNPDHDSLSFELDSCLGENAVAIPDYSFPPGFSIDPVSGEISSGGFPDSICTYSLAVKIKEWKNGSLCGYVLRDFVITIHPDTLSAYGFIPPLLQLDSGGNYFKTVNPGDNLSLQIQYVDSSTYPDLNAFSEAFNVGNPATVIINSGSSNTATA